MSLPMALAGLLAAAAAGGASKVERALSVAGAGRTVVALDAPIYERARADLGDLRVRDDEGRQVPYLLERAVDDDPAPVRHPVLRNRGFTRGQSAQATLDFGAPLLKSELTLALSGDNFRRHVVVEGRSRHESAWTTLTDTAYVFAVPGSPAARYETVALPENNFQILRVTVDHGPDDPERIEIVDAWTRPADRRRPREVPLEPRMSRLEDAEAHETVLTLDLGARFQPFRAIAVEVSDARFFRGVSVEARVDPPSRGPAEPARPLAWRHLGEAPIYRYEVGGERHESLRLPVSGRERVLRLRIRNRDDAPLVIGRVTVLVPVERLVFDAAPGRRYVLRYGDPAASPPRYDLARTAGDPALYAARAVEAALHAPRDVPVEDRDDRPWTERHPALLWAGLLAVVAAMGGVTWRALRTSA